MAPTTWGVNWDYCGIADRVVIILNPSPHYIQETLIVIVITDSVYQIFNQSIYPYQQQSIAVLKDLRLFFNKQPSNIIEFWDCPSDAK